MVFSSLVFLSIFLPATLFLYYVSPWRMRNLVLLIVSLVFYAWGEPIYIALLLLSTVTDYSFGLLLSKPELEQWKRKWIVAASMTVNLAVLGFFKYADFVIMNINSLLGSQIPLTELPLPIGISFYTFQSMSYIVDIYRGTAKTQRRWIDFATFVALFPQLVAGPIVHYATIAEQLKHRIVTNEQFAEGVRRFTIGLAKKVLLANNIGLVWSAISASSADTLPMLTAWLGIIAFAFQIYYDFSGYSDMAIGLGLMFGFRFNENFNKPYTSQSITDFWRRWHISLGTWFRDYVYIPLGGNRKGLWMQVRNILIVWLLTGIWHGASWNFLFWGLYFGIILLCEKWFMLRLLQRLPRWIRHGYALALILVGWVLFAFNELPDIVSYFRAMAGLTSMPIWDSHTLYLLYTNMILLVVLVITSLPRRTKGWNIHPIIQLSWHLVLLLVSIAYLVDATFNPFLYFRF